jgi:hypothetical protein
MLCVIMLSVIMLNFIKISFDMLSVVMLSVIMLNVVAPSHLHSLDERINLTRLGQEYKTIFRDNIPYLSFKIIEKTLSILTKQNYIKV